MNSTTTVTDANVLHISHVGTDNSMVALHVPSSQLRNNECSPNSFYNDVLLLDASENPGSPETFYIEGEPVNSSGSANASIDNSPLLLRDPNLYSASLESETKRKRLGPPPRKKKKMSSTSPRLHVNVDSPSSLCSSPPSPTHVNWPCAFCERFFSAKTSLYKHYRTIHPNRHCAKCVNPNVELVKKKSADTTRKSRSKKRKSQEEIEMDLKVKFGIKECRILVRNMTKADILKKTQLPPMLRCFDYPRMYSSSAKKVQNMDVENDENMMGSEVLIGNDILTQEIVIEEAEAKAKKDLSISRDASPKAQKTGEIFDCDVCGQVFSLKAGLICHKRFKHSEILVPNLKCDKCGKDFAQLMSYQQHIQNCGKESAYRYRNMFEELTNFRPLQVDRKNCFSKPDVSPIDRDEDDDDDIILEAEQQLLNSPTSSFKAEYDDTGNSMQVDAVECRKRKFSVEVPQNGEESRHELRSQPPAKRKLEIVANSDRRSERVLKNASRSSPVVANRVETVDPPKRKVGRPRKIRDIEPLSGPRKRGRPRKNVIRTEGDQDPTFEPPVKHRGKHRVKHHVEAKAVTELTVSGTIRLLDDDDLSFSDGSVNGEVTGTEEEVTGTEEEVTGTEEEFVDVENEDEGDMTLTLSDDETLGNNISGMLSDDMELNLMNFNEDDVEIDVTNFMDEDVDVTSQVQVGTSSEQLQELETKSKSLSDCFSVFV